MQTLTIDPLAEIGKKFSNPLDIVAFELSSAQAKRAVEKYNLYRQWEKHYMPNDDIRIIATQLFKHKNQLWFSSSAALHDVVVITFELDDKVSIRVGKIARPKLPIGFSKKYPEAIITINSNYDLLFDIYNLLDGSFRNVSTRKSSGIREVCVELFETTRTSGFKIWEDFKFPNEKYRILSLYVTYQPDQEFKKNDEILYVDEAYDRFPFVSDERGAMTYYLLENGWTIRVTDEEYHYRIVRNCLVCKVETKLVENNYSNRSFCGTECQARFYEKN